MNEKNKKIITLIIVVGLILAILGGTFAYFRWQTSTEQETSVTFTVTSSFSCSADGGDISTNNISLVPTDCTNSQYAIKRKVTTNSIINTNDKTVYMDLWLDIETLDSELADTENFRWVFTKEENSCDTANAVSYGTFEGLTDQDTIMLLDSKTYETTTRDDTYYLYIWLDKAETSTDSMDKNFEFKLNGECTDVLPLLEPIEAPVLDDGLIPVILSDNTDEYKVIATSGDDPNWYSYGKKKWANAVLVKEKGKKTRAENKVAGTEIDTSDILAYFVWIPRYAYQIWTTDATTTSSPQEIKIMWESGSAEYTEGLQVGDYRTHPAFWWDTNGDRKINSGETIRGIWVGKFETTQGTSSDIGTSYPTILPGVSPWVSQTISSQFTTAMKFSGGTMSSNVTSYGGSTTRYGLTSSVNSHMMKNSEWGSVAYLSHSVYGIEENVLYNNYYDSNSLTGCGADDNNMVDSSTICSNAYGSGINEYPQSTTGNITGVFDMSGGVSEYVMGNFANTTNNSGFATTWFNQTSNQKYYDLYPSNIFTGSYSNNITFCNIETCGGHGLFETKSWYGVGASFVYSRSPWFARGNGYTSYSSVFYADSEDGDAWSIFGFRSVLLK